MSKQEDTAAAKPADSGAKGKGGDKTIPSPPTGTPKPGLQPPKAQRMLPVSGGGERLRPNDSEAPGYAMGGLRWPD
jgi:hypothetical protein